MLVQMQVQNVSPGQITATLTHFASTTLTRHATAVKGG
jgi:hypothetical protein